MIKAPMTPEGHKKLQEKLKHLKAVERPKVIHAIEIARGHGDLSENAEYDAAKEAQAHLSREIAETEDRLSRAEVIDPSKLNHEKISFGATVTIEETESGTKVTYQIVGAHESDVKLGKISIESPIAKALIGKQAGDATQVHTPKGVREYEVLIIEYK
ncbi:MAG: transcription elongation factor GreA [Deltaproteobacteria bacterium RIFCSPLOWO2_12_FULL_44_12]|nr:MAG: transcription elongation factor GreA [Deltaproteobacteria bacterium RIFCSPHIGHO2_01_FULL_43_49]OGQ15108.1 MAG: transcription elongation factor GreA [Deltaproteobacteria bacterium RIFCSPHIGHO2_02_FULL_44_53]OGQ27272.1 MAG: transcription elongation factor GreA [Deltaproteobacteria bacterium RIFCSPHIGHO2_12_FULL_44_21]OGQ31625.1 MAG: transcription elongation factor GreA [Deltaproteobacteria bacterium RIFCSPLOWO2_01_FULL_45_74]OGQ42825.1 MAG: transcription elongation factor GreA [Deltaprote